MGKEGQKISSEGAEMNDVRGGKGKQYEYTSKTPEQYEKQIYDLQQMLEISRSLCSTFELNNLIESILYITMAQMRTIAAGIFILNADKADGFYLGNNYSGFELDASIDYTISTESKLIEILSATQNRVYTTDDLWRLMPRSGQKDLAPLESLHPTLIIPLISKNHLNGILLLGERIATNSDDGAKYDSYEIDEICIIASLASVAINNAFLIEQSSTDMMTKLKLKYYFFNTLRDKLDSAMEDGRNISVIMLDIDFFKKFNDTYGHACGDYVLKEVARQIKESVRSIDLASRYGGEEFTVMLDNTGAEEAVAVAERIRQSIEAHDFFYQDQHMKVTISLGVAVYDKETNPVASEKVFVDQADQGLYCSKRNGRNQVTLVTPELLKTLTPKK